MLAQRGQAPFVTACTLASTHSNDPTVAIVGETVTLSFAVSQPLNVEPTVTIGGVSVSPTSSGGLIFTASRAVTSNDSVTIGFAIAGGKDSAGLVLADSPVVTATSGPSTIRKGLALPVFRSCVHDYCR